MTQFDWTLAEIWNNGLLTFGVRPQEPRDYMYASEIGGSYIDRYLKMLGTKMTNPPNNRSLRKFQAGNLWEWTVGHVLARAGILKYKQIRAETNLPGLLRVSGRLDFVAGGIVDWEKATHEIDSMGLPDFIYYNIKQIIDQMRPKYEGKELLIKVFEVKSVSAFVFERIMKAKRANPNHEGQTYHYLLGNTEGIDVGAVCYICRDDCRLYEAPLYKPSPHIYETYIEDVQTMTNYYVNRQIPPKQQLIFFDEAAGRFSKNWKVEYSPYLTMIYKIKSPKDYDDMVSPQVAKFNRVFKRCVNGDKMTDANKIIIREAKKLFPLWDQYVVTAKETGVLEVTEEEEADL